MSKGVGEMGLNALPWTDATRVLRARVRFLARIFPEEGWPDLSDEALLATLDHWLTPYLAGMTRRAHLGRLDMQAIITGLIPPELTRRLDKLAPRHVAIPSGAHITIDYEGDGDPVLRARLQEMFGLAETPRIASVRKAVTIPDGTEIAAVTTETLSSKTAQEDDPITFKVEEDLIIGGDALSPREL